MLHDDPSVGRRSLNSWGLVRMSPDEPALSPAVGESRASVTLHIDEDEFRSAVRHRRSDDLARVTGLFAGAFRSVVSSGSGAVVGSGSVNAARLVLRHSTYPWIDAWAHGQQKRAVSVPRGVTAVAETREEAMRQATGGVAGFRAIDAHQIELDDLPSLAGGSLPTHWAVVVEHEDPEEEANLPQDSDPIDKCERETRLRYLTLSVDPRLLVTGTHEEFPCPDCNKLIALDLPAPRDARYPQNVQCPNCWVPLTRSRNELTWAVMPRAPRQPGGLCIFCGEPADSKEHVIPGWISKRLGIKTFLTQTSSGGRVLPQKRPISFASHRKRIFCTGCNTHFKHLEDAVIPLLVPMARGFQLVLGRQSQQLLALWATKTAIALIGATDGLAGAVPIVHRRAVRENAEVPEGVWVGFFSWRGEPTIATSRFVSVDDGRATAYGAVLAFAGIGFSVKGFERPEPAETLDGDVQPFRQFWPLRTALIEWPSPVVANRVLLPVLMNYPPARRS